MRRDAETIHPEAGEPKTWHLNHTGTVRRIVRYAEISTKTDHTQACASGFLSRIQVDTILVPRRESMKICEITAQNFKTLSDFALDFGEGYCALSGRNNCGKTAVIKIIEFFLRGSDEETFYYRESAGVIYNRDRTQWSEDGACISLSLTMKIFKDQDSEVFGFMERFGAQISDKEEATIKVASVFEKGKQNDSCYVDGVPQDERAVSEIFKKLRATSNLIVHNSTNNARPFYFAGESFVEVLQAHFSAEDRQGIAAAQKNLQAKISKATKRHKTELDGLLGKLKDFYQVELSSIDNERSSKIPLQIKLNDKFATVPLQEWGAGTQNRTRVFMSILDAQHTQESATPENRSTPVFLVEEPESFLHPSAQAEFGQILNNLADEFGIQIIATTHSPYMLNQHDPSSNYLLERKMHRKHPRETFLVKSGGDNWMVPFAENLGVVASEFHDWKNVFRSNSSNVVLVEGVIDQEYFDIFAKNYSHLYKIPADVEIVPYEGKDALKNTALLRFMINKFGRVFVTFDLDAKKELQSSLQKLGMKEGDDFIAVGLDKDGFEFIEGYLPEAVRSAVHGRCTDLVSAMMSQNSDVRRSARSKLKKEYLEEFKKGSYKDSELSNFKNLFSKISQAFT